MKRSVRKSLVVLFCLGSLIPTTSAMGDPTDPKCYAEISPNTVVGGTASQAFSLRVYNEQPLPVGLPLEEINYTRTWSNWVDLVTITSASAFAPWETRVFEPPGTMARYRDGEIQMGGSETFSLSGTVEDTTATERWTVTASRDQGTTIQVCQPIHVGALDLNVI